MQFIAGQEPRMQEGIKTQIRTFLSSLKPGHKLSYNKMMLKTFEEFMGMMTKFNKRFGDTDSFLLPSK